MGAEKAKTECWEEALSQGPWVEALCIGVDDYEPFEKLDNAVADAAAIANGIQGTCSSTAHYRASTHVLLQNLAAPSPLPSSTLRPCTRLGSPDLLLVCIQIFREGHGPMGQDK